MWEKNDINNFIQLSNQNVGQITMDTNFGKLLYNLAKDENNKKFLEIGTWNGLGTTRCINEGFKQRTDTDYFLDSLEVNMEKCEYAKTFYKDYPNVRIQNKTLLKVFPEWNKIVTDLGFQDQAVYRHWHEVDLQNTRECDLYEIKEYDVIVLDGGEFTTYYEYLLLKNKTKIIVCDDCNVAKCKRIREELINDVKWSLLSEDLKERNGFTSFVKNT